MVVVTIKPSYMPHASSLCSYDQRGCDVIPHKYELPIDVAQAIDILFRMLFLGAVWEGSRAAPALAPCRSPPKQGVKNSSASGAGANSGTGARAQRSGSKRLRDTFSSLALVGRQGRKAHRREHAGGGMHGGRGGLILAYFLGDFTSCFTHLLTCPVLPIPSLISLCSFPNYLISRLIHTARL
jgi:hypothetical protein